LLKRVFFLFEVRFSNKSEKFIKNCGNKLKNRLNELFVKLQEAPIPAKEYDLKKISGSEDTYRIRLSSYRITYAVFWEEKIIRVLFIELRGKSAYKNL
jgi:mRNA interferase RelE/StbE